MLPSEIPFPRGGKVSKKKHKIKRDTSEYPAGTVIDGCQKKSRCKKKLRKQDNRMLSRENPDVLIENLNMQSIGPGMVLLGCIFEIEDYCLKVSLPGRLFGTVPIVNISDSYSQVVKEFAENPVDEVPTLQALFRIGQTLPCKVVSTKSPGSGKNHVTLTVNPRHVNESLKPASVLHAMYLYCAVQSVEDHGYVLDTGIRDVPAFLSHTAAADYIRDCNNGETLVIGQLVPTVVNMPSLKKGRLQFGQAVTVATAITNCKLSESNVSLDVFTPGTAVVAVIEKVTEHGLIVDCLGFAGCLHKIHLKDIAKKYIGEDIQGTVLYVNPVTQVLQLSMLPKPNPKKLKKLFGGIKKWQVIEKAVVSAVYKSSICLKLKENVQGIAVKSELSDQAVENISKKFSVNDTVRCRVTALHYLDNMVSVSLKESILGQTYLSRDELTTGDVYEGKVKKLVPGGMVVVLSPGVQGFVREIHMADVPLTKPEVMFPKGKKVKCKVLSVDNSSSPPAISLTCKKGMLATKVPILSSYEEASPGVMTKGVIVNIRDNGLVVTFLNNVQGWVPSSEFGAYKIIHPEKVFFKGQVVKCRVMKCYPEDRKLLLTLKVDSTKLFGDKDMSQNKFEVGKIVEVVVKKKTEKGLDVVLKGKKFEAFLPLLHISDHIENCQHLLECYREKEVVSVLCFGSKGIPIVTRKSSLMAAAKNGVPRSQISEYEEQTVLPVVVKHFAKYGMFVELGYNITGLVPNKYIADRKISQPEEAGYVPHQSLIAKIIKIEGERNRVELSTKMEDIYHSEYSYGLDLLQSYLDDSDTIRQYYLSMDDADNVKFKLAQLSIGLVVSAKVTCVTEIGVLCVLTDGVKGFATSYHCGCQQMEEDQELRAVVLFVDMINECVELSCLPNLLRTISKLQDVDSSKVKVDQIIKGECMLVKKEFVVLALGGHAVGRFVLVPTRRALNDLIGREDLFTIGQHYHVVIKRIASNDVVLGVLKQHAKDLKNNNEVVARKRKNSEENIQAKKQKTEILALNEKSVDLQNDDVIAIGSKSISEKQNSESWDTAETSELVVGKKYVATIKKIKEFQMDVVIKNRILGRIHITEVSTDFVAGEKPFSKFKAGDNVNVWVIGFHAKKSRNFLALSHCKMKMYAECSLFKCPPVPLAHTFKSGDVIKGFVNEVNNSDITLWLAPDVKGILPLHHLNVDSKVLLKPHKYCHNGDVVEAQVFEVSGEEIQLTQYHDWVPEPGMNINGLVHVVSSDKGVSVHLPHGYSGEVHLTDLRDSYVTADDVLLPLLQKRIIHCHILDVDHNAKFCHLSTRVSRVRSSHSKPKDPELSEEDIIPGFTARGFIKSISNSAITVTLGRNLDGTVSISSLTSDERNDIFQTYLIGTVVEVKVLSSEDGKIALSMMPSQVDKLCLAVDSSPNNKRKRKKVKKDMNDETQPAAQESEPQNMPKALPCLQVSSFNFNVKSISDLKRPAENDSDGSEIEEEAKPKRDKKGSDELDNEKFVFETENFLMDENRTAQTAEEYEEVLRQSPNSAGHWLNYIGFYLEQAEVDKARNVAERALKTISFREEQEKLKVWIVYLNLESLYGTQESMQSVFERAVQQTEPLKIYSVVVHIYQKSNKIEEAESLYQTMVKKFHLNKDVWIDFGLFYMKTGRPELARKVMDRSLKSLDQKHHVDIIAKFAQMEFKHGDVNLGKTMFENILKNYRKRTDLWSVYVDLLIKQRDLGAVRKLFEEVITLKMSLRKMKFFFKRYLSFEREHGTEELANEVIKKASGYLKSDFLSVQ